MAQKLPTDSKDRTAEVFACVVKEEPKDDDIQDSEGTLQIEKSYKSGGGKYKRKTERQSWSQENMKNAVLAVLSKEMGYFKASKSFRVPSSTLEARVKAARTGSTLEEATKKGLGRHKPVFNATQEQELINYIQLMKSRLFSLTQDEIRSLAYELAERNKLPHSFNREKKIAGKCWLYSFLDRHPELSPRSVETALPSKTGFNPQVVKQFYELLSELYDRYSFTPDRIYNVDESGVITVSNKSSKILPLRRKYQTDSIAFAEKGIFVTAQNCMSASGVFMPPTLVLPCEETLFESLKKDIIIEFHPSGCMQKEVFLNWFQRFINFSVPTKDKPVILLVSGSLRHVKNIQVMELSQKNHIHLLCCPPHWSQPLEVSFNPSLTTCYSEEVNSWFQFHPGKELTINEIAKLYGTAFSKAASVENAVNGFRKTGVFPFDPSVFSHWIFESAKMTDSCLKAEEENDNSSISAESIEEASAFFQHFLVPSEDINATKRKKVQ